MTFGEKLKEARLNKGFTQKILAKKMGCSNNAIFYWENDMSEPSLKSVAILSQILGVSLNYLAGLEEMEG